MRSIQFTNQGLELRTPLWVTRFKEWVWLKTLPWRCLWYINRFRRKMDLPILWRVPKGYRANATNCPMARAVNFGISMGGWSADLTTIPGSEQREFVYQALEASGWEQADPHFRDSLKNPAPIAAFISRFDGQELPKYML